MSLIVIIVAVCFIDKLIYIYTFQALRFPINGHGIFIFSSAFCTTQFLRQAVFLLICILVAKSVPLRIVHLYLSRWFFSFLIFVFAIAILVFTFVLICINNTRQVAFITASCISVFHLLFSNGLRRKLVLSLHFRVCQCPPGRGAGRGNT